MVNRALLSVTMLSSFLFSQNLSLEQFTGIELGYGKVDSKNAINASESKNGFDIGLKVGVQDYYWRTTFSANYFKEETQESLNTIISIDRYLFAGVYETEDTIMKPYMGFHTGWLNYKDTGVKDNGLVYGLQLGFAWGLSTGIDFDLGYRRSFTAVEKVNTIDIFSMSINYIF